MADAALATFQQAQKALVEALQLEYFCDLEPPLTAFGWAPDEYKKFYQSGGQEQPAAPVAPAAPIEPAIAQGDEDANESDPALMMFLKESDDGAFAPSHALLACFFLLAVFDQASSFNQDVSSFDTSSATSFDDSDPRTIHLSCFYRSHARRR